MRVVVHGLTKEFMTGQGKFRALGGVDLEVRDREFFGIIGPTGRSVANTGPAQRGVNPFPRLLDFS
jgi:ABC-type glutathione transport system ATPase component